MKQIQTYAFILQPGETFKPMASGYTIKNDLDVPLDVTILNAGDIRLNWPRLRKLPVE